ncbi:MAG: cytochrome c biogenesis heme-transporting ATPase CcmA [Legionella sp.]|nr:cytochrome c biogenesis heme-transporting ATPase CcmA [Legionella sp.]
MLQINSLAFDYHDTPLLRGVQFSLQGGELLHLRGGNGAGKTTLLRLLAGLLQPLEGDILWDDHSIHNDLPSYQRNVCYIGHKTGLSPELTVKENCCLDLHAPGRITSFSTLLEQFNLAGLAHKPCYQLSQGQRRRVALLRVAITRARLWLLDEPLVALDNAAIISFTDCLKQHLFDGGLIIMTSHQNLPANFVNYAEYSL